MPVGGGLPIPWPTWSQTLRTVLTHERPLIISCSLPSVGVVVYVHRRICNVYVYVHVYVHVYAYVYTYMLYIHTFNHIAYNIVYVCGVVAQNVYIHV